MLVRLLFAGAILLSFTKGKPKMSEGNEARGYRDKFRSGGGSSDRGSSGRYNPAKEQLNELKAERVSKLNESMRLDTSIRSLEADIRTKDDILTNMSYTNPGRDGLQQQIEGLNLELEAEREAKEQLGAEIRELSDAIDSFRR